MLLAKRKFAGSVSAYQLIENRGRNSAMSKSVVVRYRTRPETADENASLIEKVFAALADVAPAGFQYATYRLADGVSFVHVASHADDDNPLTRLPEFAEFQRELPQRIADPPVPSDATIVGSYGLPRV
jgi:hypothetical protein